jgi:hypothetical protein
MIHIIRHKDYDFPIPSGYVTCEVGPLYKGDRPNINYLNPIINELTGIYDVWQNFDDPFVGFCHYHRFFTSEKGQTLDQKELYDILYDDIIVPYHVTYPDMTIRQSLERDFREDLPTFNKYMDMLYEAEPGLKKYFDGDTFHPRNMFFCRRSLFEEYCRWLFPLIIPIAERFKEEDFNRYHHYYSRMIGFIAERLMTYYLIKNNYKWQELPYNEF